MYKPRMKIYAKDVLSVHQPEPLFWETIPPPEYPRKITNKSSDAQFGRAGRPAEARRKTKPSKSVSNPNNIHLKDCWSYAVRDDYLSPSLAWNLANILTGVSRLDLGGNTRPVRKGLLFDMLRDLDEINVRSVMHYSGLSESHCRKLAGLLRVAVNALDRLTKKLNHDAVTPLRIPITENAQSLDCLSPVAPLYIGDRISA